LDDPQKALPLLTSCHKIHDEFIEEIMKTDTPTLVYLECDRRTALEFLVQETPYSARIIHKQRDFVECSTSSPDMVQVC